MIVSDSKNWDESNHRKISLFPNKNIYYLAVADYVVLNGQKNYIVNLQCINSKMMTKITVNSDRIIMHHRFYMYNWRQLYLFIWEKMTYNNNNGCFLNN